MNIHFGKKHISLIATTAVCLLLYLAASLRYPNFFSARVFINFFTDNAFLGITAVGMTFVILSGGIDLSVGSMVGFTSVLIAALITDCHLHPLISIPIVLAVGAFFGLVTGCLISFYSLPPFLVTLAGMFLARGLGFVIRLNSIPIKHPFYDSFSRLGIGLGSGVFVPATALTFIIVLAAGIYLAQLTKFGRNTYAIGGNEQSAMLMGVPVKATKVKIYTLSGLCSALAGVVFTLYTSSGDPRAGVGLELDAIAAVVIGGTLLTGGVGYVAGTLMGVLILGIIQTLITFEGTLSSWWTRIAIGLLLLVFIVLQQAIGKLSKASAKKPNTAPIARQ